MRTTRIRLFEIVLWALIIPGAVLLAQGATEPVSAPGTLPTVSATELVAAYRQTWFYASQRVADHQVRLVATPEYKAFEEVRQQLLKIEADLGAKVLAKTGKTMTWATGELK